MDLEPSDAEEAIRAASEAFLADTFPLADARNRPGDAWVRIAEMGWLGITLPETAGGIDMGLGTEALVFAELGRYLAPVGVIGAAVAARIASDSGDRDLAVAIAEGRERVALGIADKDDIRLLDVENAGLFTLIGADEAAIHALPDEPETRSCLDPSVCMARIARPRSEPRVYMRGSRGQLHQQLAAAAFALGCAEAGRDMAVDYAKTREQFGKPIGGFQALKHIMADMAVRASAARAQLLYAALALQQGRDDAAFQVAAAKRLADVAAVENGRANIQVHGGIGMTDEASPHLVLKRAHLLTFVSPADAAALL